MRKATALNLCVANGCDNEAERGGVLCAFHEMQDDSDELCAAHLGFAGDKHPDGWHDVSPAKAFKRTARPVKKKAPDYHKRPAGRQPMYSKNGQLQRLFDCIAAGMGVREVARHVDCSKGRAMRAMRIYVARFGWTKCACGRRTGHRGWCAHRYSKSPARQEVVRKMDRAAAGRARVGTKYRRRKQKRIAA
jgi:hypothetical protein